MEKVIAVRDRRICVVINRKAGRKRGGAILGAMSARFAAHGVTADLRVLKRRENIGAAVARARNEGFATIVAAGGDGTIAAAANALRHSGVRLGVIPFGTFNYFARSLGVPETMEGAIDAIVTGAATSVSVATLNDGVFLNNANFGVYPDMLAEREANYARWGRSRIGAYWSALTTLTRLPKPLALTITTADGWQEVRTPVAFVFSNAFQMRQMGLEGAESVEDGNLAMLVAPNGGRWGLIKSGFALLFGRMTRGDDFALISAQEVEVIAKRKALRVARDGERERLRGPYRFAMHRDALIVMTPG